MRGQADRPLHILIQGEKNARAMTMARERAADGGWRKPQTPADYLGWIEDEIKVLGAVLKEKLSDADRTSASEYGEALRMVVRKLRLIGVMPSDPFVKVGA